MKKNLLFIMLDQLRYDSIACNGNSIVKTPNIDKIAKSGVSFQNYFSNAPVCVPSRCTLFTGKYLNTHKVRENHTFLEAGREIHLFRVLKQAGYRIGYVGKNHLLQDPEFVNFDFCDVEHYNHEMTTGEKKIYDFSRTCGQRMNELGCFAGPEYYDFPQEDATVYRYATSVCDFIKAENDDPFCACLSILEPHAPHHAPREFEAMYKDAIKDLPTSSIEELKQKASRYYIKYLAQKGDTATAEDQKKFIAMYYSMISFVDRQIGRVLDALKESGKQKDTLIVFTTDHGEFLFDHAMCKKDLVMCDSLLHVPLLISMPGVINEGQKASSMAEEVDVMPTILDLLDIEVPFGAQGKSLVPYIQGKTEKHKDAVYAEICPPWLNNPFKDFQAVSDYWLKEVRASNVSFNIPGDYTKSVRTMDYRYVWYNTGEEELYDSKNDPSERCNLANDEKYAEVKLKLKLQLFEWHILNEDPIDSKIFDVLQYKYSNWITAKPVDEKVQYGPYWFSYYKNFNK